MSANDDKRKQSIESGEKYAYGTIKYLVCKKEGTKYNDILKPYKNF